MSVSFEFNWDDVQKKVEKLKKQATDTLHKEVENAILESALRVEADAVNNVPVNNGELRNSISTRWEGSGVNIKAEVFSSVPYALYVEFGTRPHKAPFDAIREYAKEVGKEEDWFLIWKGIAEKGTKAQPFMTPAFYKNETWIKTAIARAVAKGLKG